MNRIAALSQCNTFEIIPYSVKVFVTCIIYLITLFSKNYSTAKRVQAFSSKGDFEKAKKLMIEMSENYKVLIDLFPENTQEGFDTEALLTIWDEKDDFNALMQKASDDMIKLTSVIEDAEDIRGTLKQFMWSNCKACHSRYREEH
jgi:cytochrome c556